MSQIYADHVLEARVFADAVSEMWHARHVDRATQRATVRIIDPSRAAQLAPAIEPYLAEARAAAELTHRNILRAYSVGDVEQPYVIERYAPAVAWAEHVRGGMGTAEAIELLAPLASALDAAADAGTPHGALHPGTIWIEGVGSQSGSPRALLTGFGLHHLLSIVAAGGDDGRCIDDFLYVAPELLRGGSPTNRSDQYALAAALFHAVTGRPIFERERLSALFGAHLFGRPPAVVTPDPDEAAALTRVFARGLAKVPDERYETCEQFMSELARSRSAAGSQSVAPVGVLRAADSAHRPAPLPAGVVNPPPRTRPLARVAIGAAAIVAVLTTLWLVRSPAALDGSETVASQAGPSAAQTLPAGEANDPSVRWEQRLESRAIALHVTAEGLVAVTRTGAVLVDTATGDVRTEVSAAGPPGAVVTGGRFVTPGAGSLRAVSIADGSVMWQAPIDTTSATVGGDTVYAVGDGEIPRLVATDAASGERLWEFPKDEVAFPADAAVAARDDFVYLADGSAMYGILPEGAMAGEDTPLITATEAAGEPLCLWRHEVGEKMWTSSLRATEDGVVVANRAGTVCLRRHTDGEALWCVPVRGVERAEPTIHVTNGRLFVVTRSAATAIDTTTGERSWSRAGAWRQSAVTGDRLVVVDRDGAIATLSLATGSVARPVDIKATRPSALAVDGDTLYVGGRDGTLLSVALTTPQS